MDPISILVQIAIAVVISLIAYAIMPKPKQQKPPETSDMDSPTAEAGRPVPVIFGTVTVKGLNVLWFGDKNKAEYQVKV
jgi:hypothetical protein